MPKLRFLHGTRAWIVPKNLTAGYRAPRWIHMGQCKIQAKLNVTGTIAKRFVYGTKSNIPDFYIAGRVEYRIISNHIGTPEVILNSTTGALVEKRFVDEFGMYVSGAPASILPLGFAGGLVDADTGLVRFGARDYDPETGRWLSKDPILFNGGDTNLYGYVMNEPINFIDPTGLWRWPGDIYNDATRNAEGSDLPGPHNGLQDGYRHCLASCMMTQENGNFLSNLLGDANEKWGDWRKNQQSGEKCMDLHNNAKGRDFGKNGGDCAQQCMNAALGGGLKTYNRGTTPGYWK